jgi:hypothetical protein
VLEIFRTIVEVSIVISKHKSSYFSNGGYDINITFYVGRLVRRPGRVGWSI